MAKNAYYFSHDSNASDDPKILELLAEYNWAGYGMYWALVEKMFNEDTTDLEIKRIKGLARSMCIDAETLTNMIEFCIGAELFDSDGETFWSNSLRERKAKFENAREQRVLAGKKSAEARAKNKEKSTTVERPLNEKSATAEQSKVKESKVKEKKEKEIKEKNKDIYSAEISTIVIYLNNVLGSNYKADSKATIALCKKLLDEGYTVEDFKAVIDKKNAEWKDDPNMSVYLRPATLFQYGKFEGYLNQKTVARTNQVRTTLLGEKGCIYSDDELPF